MIPDNSVQGYHILFPLDLAVTVLSILGSSLTCYFCLRLPSYNKTVSVKFIIALSIADFFYSIANVISNFESENSFTLCAVESWIRQSSYVLSIFFSACIAIVSYKSSLPDSIFNSNKFFMLTTLIGPLIFLLASIFMPIFYSDHLVVGFGPINCSIIASSKDGPGMSLLFFMIYRGLPIILALLTILRGYIYTIGEVNKLPESLVRQLNFKPYKLLVYPIVLILTFVPSLIDQIWNIFDENRSIWVVILRVAVTHSIGFINALMYILLRELYQVPNRKSEEEALLNFRRTSLFLNSDFWTNANYTSHLASPCSPDYRSPGIC